ncbi:MAG: ATP-binding cassette domain-containing protein [Gemmatimonadetes bacterium]|nr:ATP-binding cassette domain-containing protein [Gemmatimonadota bacterium]
MIDPARPLATPLATPIAASLAAPRSAPRQAPPSGPIPPRLRCAGIGRRWSDPFGERSPIDALDGVDLAVGAGEIVCVEGPAGAGKSTLLMIAAGDVTPTRGEVWWDGEPQADAVRPHRMRGRPWEYGALTVREALRHHAEQVARREPGWAAPSRFVPLLRRVGLRGLARERLGALTPIDAFRVVVAQARLSRPGLVVADDVLAALPLADLPVAVALLQGLADGGAAVLLALRDAAPVVATANATTTGTPGGVRRVRFEAGRLVTPRLLELDVAPATPAQWRRLVATLPSMRRAGRRWRIPLDGRTPEQVLARCREAGVGVRGSQVVERPG